MLIQQMTIRTLFLLPILLLLALTPARAADKAVATFAGGCFWCVEHDFDPIKGVISTTSGYIGGQQESPTYKEVSKGGTGHTEAVQIIYDPAQVSYAQLLKRFWTGIDPTTPNAQFCDHGEQYRAEIFVHTPGQRAAAQKSLKNLKASKPFAQPIVVPITEASRFYPAETYHQDYAHKNPLRYNFYRFRCGRDHRLQELWQGYDAELLIKGIE
uniref:Peptide methionine sulfoxide reductase MsrA n=1 Tax=Magnetococcus massalia (strain MO-1) TaxID=451514 RepID=A0A1S7LEU3_MAGMO|nr:Peptide methionine sulfoxide reductase msrA 2 [Candidatus Magnetococcus massalia]